MTEVALTNYLMRAMAVHTPAPIETNPLQAVEVERPRPQAGELLVRIRMCGVCRTDLHIAEGDLPPRHRWIIPGHEVVGEVIELGEGCLKCEVQWIADFLVPEERIISQHLGVCNSVLER